MWTFIEYYFHRFLLHTELNLDPTKEADGEKNALMFTKHIHHHVFMNQRHRIVIGVLETYQYLFSGGLVGYCFLPLHTVLVLMAGFTCGSLVYDGMHLAFHFDDVLP